MNDDCKAYVYLYYMDPSLTVYRKEHFRSFFNTYSPYRRANILPRAFAERWLLRTCINRSNGSAAAWRMIFFRRSDREAAVTNDLLPAREKVLLFN